jgi:hypothetical protein
MYEPSFQMKVLAKAQTYVEKHGDINWFNEHYWLSRECQYSSIIDSIEEAMRRQNLWDAFTNEVFGL